MQRDGYSIEAAVEKGRELPEWFDECDPPDPELGEDFYFRAFWDLHTCRHIGMGFGPIPWNTIVEYGFLQDLDRDMLRPFIRIIREMDTAYLEWQAAQADRTQGSTSSGSPPSAPRKYVK